MRRWLGIGVLLLGAVLAAGCSDGGPKQARQTATASPVVSPSVTPVVSPSVTPTPARTGTPSVTATATATATASRTPSATPGRTDGTVAPQGFGSTDPVTIKANPDPPGRQALLTDVRMGAHPEEGGWDRIVFEFRDVRPAGTVAYVSAIAACGSGQPVRVPGQALLAVRFTGVDAHTEAGQLSIPSTTLTGPGGAIVEARQTCDFEGHVEWAIGVTGVKRYKVTLLQSPTRAVIDVKW